MLPDSARSSGRVLSGGHAEDADSSDNMARDIEFDAKRQAPSIVVFGGHQKIEKGRRLKDGRSCFALSLGQPHLSSRKRSSPRRYELVPFFAAEANVCSKRGSG